MSKWKKVGKLHRRNDFSGHPIESLHRALKKLAPKSTSVSDVAVSPATNDHLKEKLTQYWKKQTPKHRLEMAVAMEMLCYSPADYEEGDDFYVYVRVEET